MLEKNIDDHCNVDGDLRGNKQPQGPTMHGQIRGGICDRIVSIWTQINSVEPLPRLTKESFVFHYNDVVRRVSLCSCPERAG